MGNARNIAFWVVLFLLILALFNLFNGNQSTLQSNTRSYSDFVSAVEAGQVSQVTLDGEQVRYRGSDGRDYVTIKPQDAEVTQLLIDENIPVSARSQEQSGFTTFLLSLLPFLLLIGVWIYFMNRMQGGGRGGAMGFGKSRAKLLTEKHGRVTFDDVAGIDEAKEELEEIVEFLRNPQKFSRLGGKIPKGALLVGPPGTGKTLLARAIAGEAGVPFFTISGSDFVEMFVGVGASRVRDMFEQAKKNAPCIVFIDEIDAVGRSRGVGYGGGNDEREQTLNQLLVEMDGFEANEGIIIVAATNRPDVLDPALLRPGRFDRQVQVPNPDIKGREKILGVHARKVPLGPDVDLRIIARGTPGFSGADLANLVNEAALMAARVGRRFVTMIDFESAKDKVMMGAERRSMVMSEEEKMLTAYHEAGHAIVGLNVPQHDPIHKATIIPRGRALGLVLSLPERDQLSVTFTKYRSKIAMAMGGKVAEELKFGRENVTSGATSDIQQVSKIARAMVTQFGYDPDLGHVDYANEQQSYLGNYGGGTNHSPETQKIIDQKVKQLIDEGYETAKRILTEHEEEWERLAQGLLEYETLTGSEITKVINGEPLNRGDDGDDTSTNQGPGASVTSIPKTKPRKPKADDSGPEPEPVT
ncbi:ATP-dependent zinc metalloprotease FtsH [Ponticoccus sp. SC2-23]|uniref:ATP-dependent zinc metalloprotease FtsH n=1 Tax=Alexandriicola marinus TaxID=2081710 RepID=UPI000FD9DCE8|nr:ATP-dependent zinc metalloprotease FtsH [Alexandriicola marinus]MBM1221540.1 ATP-dependent zinc metalloprotease FtsH [Ponticoccus sp. SC6-9]MBM1226581.1 ATP-dependent zinc metalloprotease FtsH [Ponticoccus sp. SC6-15]MBM1230532.1 ATP-dependent zinc metalloprotease FtsH [Ponticoccus sp. SC6-38]MBM1235055.1 ATP-dependent zinc metalloprotease FtsH [Ponticoccus sp. SC6-45]MBM1239553.1 ATP-dependent zinc metalloprotease FtsH [Ponticoccus sp. SC6-49]MBM1243335.1 ATP-dependent zinc metalloproteas